MTLGPPLEAACTTTKRVLLAAPKGFCAGVIRAIAAVEKARELHSPPIYVRHEIVHNKYVVKTLEKKGAIFVDETFEVPEGNIVMFSAHGVSPTVHDEAAERKLATIDATCPLVTKVHKEAVRFASEDYDILLIGHEGHAEVIGTWGEAPDHITLVDGPGDVGHVEVRDPATPPGRLRQPRADRQAGPGRPTGGQAHRPARPFLQNAEPGDRAVLHALLDDPDLDEDGAAHIRDIHGLTGARDQVEQLIRTRRAQAEHALAQARLPPAAAGALRRIADATTSRTS
jgi:hypothetical protein